MTTYPRTLGDSNSVRLFSIIESTRTIMGFGMDVYRIYQILTEMIKSDDPDYNSLFSRYLALISADVERIRGGFTNRRPVDHMYSLAEMQIMEASRRWNQYRQQPDSQYLRDEFFKSGVQLLVSVEHLLAGLNGEYFINDDIVKMTRDQVAVRLLIN